MKGKWPPAITSCLTKNPLLLNFPFQIIISFPAWLSWWLPILYLFPGNNTNTFSFRWKANRPWPMDQVHKRRCDSFYLPHNLKVTSQNTFQRDCMSGSKPWFPIPSISSK
jgi:hypothetical protein